MNETKHKTVTRSRLTLILLVIIFILPIALAWYVSKNKSLQPTNTKNYGELFQPVRPLPDFKLKKLDGSEFVLEDLRRKWSVIYFVANNCNKICQESLVKVRDARLSQSGEALRVQYFLIYTQAPLQSELPVLAKNHQRMVVLIAEPEKSSELLDAFMMEGDVSLEQAHRVYLVDPIGNLMMYYPEGFHGNGLLKDLRHLLHWSQIG